MINSVQNKYIEIRDDVLGGTPCFKNSRIPIEVILEYFFLGWSLKDILKMYPKLKKYEL